MKKHLVPKTILGYRFVRLLHPGAPHRSFVYAQYRNSHGRKGFAKLWINDRKSFDYHSLVNEKNWYEAFEKMRKAERKNHGAKGVHIPNYIGWEEGPHFAALLTQLVNGHTAEFLPASQQYSKILLVRKFLQSVSSSALRLKWRGYHMNIKRHYQAMLAFPLFLIKARKQPFVAKHFKRIVHRYLDSLRLLFVSFPTIVVHKSIEPKNIIISNKKTYLVDFQLAAFSNPVIDIVETLFFCWSNKKLRQLVIEHDVESIMRSKTYKDLFRFLTLYTGIHQLSEEVVQPHAIEEYLSFSLSL